MNAGELHSNIKSALACDKVESIYKSVREYQIAHCYSPVRVRVFNSVLGKYEMKDLPCGKCPHCAETKCNEWVTRMIAHLEDFKYCYFVTLTYRSFEPEITTTKRNSAKYVLMNYLRDALFVCDSNNENNHYSWNPCVLCKKHYQNFLKRLRLIVGDTICFVVRGEYGKRYGRPHYHFVLYSNVPITEEQVKTAWSLVVCSHKGVWKQKTSQKTDKVSHILLGRVDYHDLVANGTIPDLDKNLFTCEGQQLSVKKCFSYVCKYIHKNEYNSSRVALSHRFLCPVLDELEPFYNDDCETFVSDTYLKNLYNDAKIYCESLSAFLVDDFGQIRRLYPDSWRDYQRCFKPFNECSRGTAIGSLFIKRNLQKYIEGVEVRPRFQTGCFICPNYFTRKVNEYLFGFRQTSTTPSHCATKGNLATMEYYFTKESEDKILGIIGYDVTRPHLEMDLFNSRYAFKDLSTGERWLIPYDPYNILFNDAETTAYCFKYSRDTKTYEPVKKCSLLHFITLWLSKYLVYKQKYLTQYTESQLSAKLLEDCRDLCNEFLHNGANQYVAPFDSIVNAVQKSLLHIKESDDIKYNITHINNL